jgi:hypothetical protein
LPDNLSVSGDLDLRHTGVTKLPDNLSVGGNLHLFGTDVTELPDNLKVGQRVRGFNPPAPIDPHDKKPSMPNLQPHP